MLIRIGQHELTFLPPRERGTYNLEAYSPFPVITPHANLPRQTSAYNPRGSEDKWPNFCHLTGAVQKEKITKPKKAFKGKASKS